MEVCTYLVLLIRAFIDLNTCFYQFAVSPIARGKGVAPAQLPSAAGPGASDLDEIQLRKALAEARILDIKERLATRQSEAVGNVDVERGRAPSGTVYKLRFVCVSYFYDILPSF